MYKRGLFILLYVLFICSCNKEGDSYSPKITITKPYENQFFMAGETVNVLATICDDRKLENVNIKILNNNFVGVSASQTFYPENNCTEINRDISIDNILLPGGTYYVQVSAFDGTNTTNEFRKIRINEVSKKLKFILVLTKKNGALTINKIDSLHHVSQLKTITTDYCGSAVSCDAQQLYIAGRHTGDVSVYGISDWQLLWNVPVIVNPPFPYFKAVDVHNTQLYVSFREGRFAIYNGTGSIIASRMVENGEYPLAFLPLGDHLITYEVSPNGMQKHLVAYFIPSMMIYKKILVNFEILKILPFSDEECLLFCNNVSQGLVKIFSLSTGDISSIYSFPYGPFTEVSPVSTDQYLFSTKSGVWLFSYYPASAVPWTNMQNPRCLVYEGIERCYYFSENYFTVRKNRFMPQEAINSFSFQDTVIDILPVYNKD